MFNWLQFPGLSARGGAAVSWALLAFSICATGWGQGQTETISYPNFLSTSGLNLVPYAVTTTGYLGQEVLRLTPAKMSQGGAAWSTNSVSFSSGAGTFSTFFQFQITNPSQPPADGIVFVLQTVSNGVGFNGGLIGYGGITPSVGIEFDTYLNPEFDDPNDNHVGIDIGGSLVSLMTATPGGVANCTSPMGVASCMANGDLWSVWIDYDGANLVVAVADKSMTRPATNLISYPINLPCVLAGGNPNGTNCPTPATTAYVGFTSGTGTFYENHDIVDWTYTNTYNPINSAPLVITTTSLPTGTVNATYFAQLFGAGGTVPYTWSAAGLPPGLTVINGAIDGIPTVSGTYAVSLTVRDSSSPQLNATTTQALTLIINPAPLTVACSPQSGTYSAGSQYSTTCTASGGTAPFTWSFSPSLPSWLRPSAITTVGPSITLTGTVPSAPPNSYSVGVTVNDSGTPAKQMASTTVTINLAATVSCNPQSGNYPPGSQYSTTCTVVGGTPPYAWFFSPTLPSWLNPSGTATTGPSITLSGVVPSVPPNSYSVGISFTDSSTPTKQTASATVIINVANLTVSCSPASGTYSPGAQYSATCTVSGGAPPYTWSFASTLPSWLKSSATLGSSITLSGIVPSAPPSSYSVDVTATDSTSPSPQTASTTLAVTLPSLTASCVLEASAPIGGAQYSNTCMALGGTGPYAWSFPSLPSWLKSSATSGATITLSGTVPVPPPASYSVAVTATDSSIPTKQTASTSVTINVVSSLQLSCNSVIGPSLVGVPYAAVCTATGGASPYAFSLSAGSLPSGLKGAASAATYTISGNPTGAASYTYTVQVKDSSGQSATQLFSGAVSPAPAVSTFTLAAVPSVANQYNTNLTLSSAPPVPLSGTLCLTFTANSSVVNASSYQSQEVVFANGTTSAACSSALKTTLAFTVPAAGTAAVWSGNSSQFSEGTVAGTITVVMNTLVDPSGNSVLPSPSPTPQTITVPLGAPTVTVSPTISTTSNSVTVVFAAVTPTRGITGATFTFNPGGMAVPVSFTSGTFSGDDQSQWFGKAASLATGGSFSLSATFSCTNCSALTGVQVALTN
jgi:hypothetical protein